MAVRTYLMCPTCGGMKTEEQLAAELPDPVIGINTIGGRGRCSWEYRPLTRENAISLRARLAAALAKLDAELGDEE